MMNIPPAIANNPNIPHEILNGLQAGRLGSTVFVANVRRFDHSFHVSARCFPLWI